MADQKHGSSKHMTPNLVLGHWTNKNQKTKKPLPIRSITSSSGSNSDNVRADKKNDGVRELAELQHEKTQADTQNASEHKTSCERVKKNFIQTPITNRWTNQWYGIHTVSVKK